MSSPGIGGLQPEETAAGSPAPSPPIPNTEASIAMGKRVYGFLGCAECHGRDGKALIEVVANATDLTDPEIWEGGTDAQGVFRSIRDGAGLGMPPYAAEVSDEAELWHLVNYVRSLWPEGRRPPLVTEPK